MPTASRATMLAAALLAVPGSALAEDGLGLTLEAFAGVSRYDVAGLKAGLVSEGRDLLQSNMTAYGGALVLRLGHLDLGALYEGGLVRSKTDAAVITPLVGLALPLGEAVRIDLLGELGGHRISNVQFSGGLDISQAHTVWLPYVGVRPSLTVRLPYHLIAFAAAFARWDLVRENATLTVSGATVETRTYELGGTTFGAVAGAGLEL
jgi:hypothetical protein